MGTLQISLLGGFLLRREGLPLDPVPLRAGRSLFAFLVMNRERSHTRDLLAGTFWPDLPDSRARRRLSQALWQIQTVLGGDDDAGRIMQTTADSVRFNPDADFWLDVDEFEWTLEQATPAAVASRSEEADLLTAAVDLYRGDLLAGFYDDWLIPDQERLRERLLGALERLSDLIMSRGDHETALLHARRLAQIDPFREEAHRRVMRLAVLLGRHNDAIRQYESCRRVLQEELGTEPSPATRALHERTLADRELGHYTAVGRPDSPLFDTEEQVPFVGRDRERSLLVERLDGAIDSLGGLLLVEGESGVGKTRLLAEVVNDAHWRGMDVLWGRSPPSGGQPYAALAEALSGGLTALRTRQIAQHLEPIWRDQLAPLLPQLASPEAAREPESPLPPADEQARMREAITLAFLGLARIVPTLVVLEDVHWADEDTLQALAQLAGRIESHGLVLAVSYRHAEARERPEVWELLRSLDRRPYGERLSLTPYSPAQTEELIRRALGLPEVSGFLSQRLHRETGGIPLFVIEMLRALSEQGALDTFESRLDAADTDEHLPLTPMVHDLIKGRIAGLDPGARAALDLISVHDGDLTLSEIVVASEQDDQAVLESVDDLMHRRLITEQSGGFAIGHELMRRVVYDALPLSVRIDLHRRVALAVEQHRPDQIEVLAHHFATALVLDRAADYLERAAARALSVHAYDTAALHLARAADALERIEAPFERRFEVASRQEEVLDTLARRDEQEQALEKMARCATDEQQSDVHRRRSWWLAHQDRIAEAEEEARTALEVARRAEDGGRSVAALSTLGMIACFAGRAADGVVHLEQAAGFRGADRRQQADARNSLGQNLIDLQRFDEAESQLLASLALYGELQDARGQADVLGMLATLRMERGEPESAEADYRRAIELSRKIGYRHGEAVYEMNLGILLALHNRLMEAFGSFEAAAGTYSEMGNGRGRALVLSNAAWLRHAVLGDNEGAERDVLEALETYRDIGDIRGEAQCLGTLGSIRAQTSSVREGLDLLRKGLRIALDAEDSWIGAQILKEAASTALRAGLSDVALEYADRALEVCTNAGINDLAVIILAIKGRVELALGKVDEAVETTTQAMSEYRTDVGLGAHLVPFANAEALLAAGRSVDADKLLRTAHNQLLQLVGELPEPERDHALKVVPDHNEIATAWHARQPTTVRLRIAQSGAPSGRPLSSDEMIEIEWTVGLPQDAEVPDRVDRRRHRLLRLLSEADTQGGSPTIGDLSQALGASEATVRRDLSALRAEGHSVNTRGSRSHH